jgi:hypothetical protein
MAINQFRAHVRFYLMAACERHVTIELNRAREAGETERAGYVEEFLCELRADSADSACQRDWSECVGCPQSGTCATEREHNKPADCKGCPGDSGLGVSVDFAGCPYPEDGTGCPCERDCADEN